MSERFSPELLRVLAALPRLRHYRNTTTVLEISGVALIVEDVLKASVAANIPLLLVSGTGDGKSLAGAEICETWFGGRGTRLRGDGGEPAAKAYLRTNLTRLFRRRATSDEALVEPTERLGWGFLFADELNRQLVTAQQSELLGILDGAVTYRGRSFRLGTADGFFAVLAAMNVGDDYVATNVLDEALRQRFPMVLELDRHAANLGDFASVRSGRLSPLRENWLAELERARRELRGSEDPDSDWLAPTGMRLAGAFVLDQLNRCDLLDQPKRAVGSRLPRLCEERACPHMTRGCHRVGETPWRTLLWLERVTYALQAVARAKAMRGSFRMDPPSIDSDLLDYLEVLRVLGWPASNVLIRTGNDDQSGREHADAIVQEIVASFTAHRAVILSAVTQRRVEERALGPWKRPVLALLGASGHTVRLLGKGP